MFLCVSLVWKIAGGAGGVGVHACMWMILSMAMLSSTLGKSSTVSLLPILGGWARRARWWCRVQHSQAWTQRMLTFAFPDCCRERKNLLFHMLVLVATLSSTHCPSHPPLPPPFSSLNQMAPWTLFTLGDGPRCRVCPSASPFRPVSFLIPSLPLSWSASWSSHTEKGVSSIHTLLHFFNLSFLFTHFPPSLSLKALFAPSQTPSQPPSQPQYVFLIRSSFPHPHLFSMHCVCVDIWELPYVGMLKIEIGLQMLQAQRARCI